MFQHILLSVGLVLMGLAALLGIPEGKPYYRLGLLLAGALFSITGQVVSFLHSRDLKAKVKAVQPRSLSKAQRDKLLRTLVHQTGSIGFINGCMDGESADYADQLEEVFRNAGWAIARRNQSFLGGIQGYLTMGVTGDNLETTSRFIKDSLTQVGIDLRCEDVREGSLAGALDDNSVYIIVGRK